MQTIYQLDEHGFFTGLTDAVAEDAPAPVGWTRSQPPATSTGEYAVFDGRWRVVSGQPHKLAAELAALADAYRTDTLEFQRLLATVTLADGPTEAAKIASLRTKWQVRQSKYMTDMAAVRAKYA